MKDKILFFIIQLISFFPYKLINKIITILNYSIGKGFYHCTEPSVKNEVKCISKLIQKKIKVIFDVGANIGLYTDHCIKIYPNAKYFLFEPNYKNFKFLKEKYKILDNVKIYNYAISDKNKKNGILYSNFNGSGYASLIRRNLLHRKINMKKIKENIKTITLENFIIKNKIKNIDLCKIDVEGLELNVLQGINKKINIVNLIQFEISSGQIECKNYFKDFWYFFKENGYQIFIITPSGPQIIENYNERYEFFNETNYIALKNKFSEIIQS